MRIFILAALVASAASLVSATVEAKGPRSVTCESHDDKPYSCKVADYKRVELVRQLSETRCIRDRNWWVRDDRIVVSKGCRAEFDVYEYDIR